MISLVLQHYHNRSNIISILYQFWPKSDDLKDLTLHSLSTEDFARHSVRLILNNTIYMHKSQT